MKNMTKNAKIFTIISIIISSIFLYLLYTNLRAGIYLNIAMISFGYALCMFIAGLILGYKDDARKTRKDLGFLYHIITFITVNPISIIMSFFLLGVNEKSIFNIILQLLIWGLILVIHYLFARKRIKGYSKEDIFV